MISIMYYYQSLIRENFPFNIGEAIGVTVCDLATVGGTLYLRSIL